MLNVISRRNVFRESSVTAFGMNSSIIKQDVYSYFYENRTRKIYLGEFFLKIYIEIHILGGS